MCCRASGAFRSGALKTEGNKIEKRLGCSSSDRTKNDVTPLSRSGLCIICSGLHFVSDEKPGDISSLLVFIVLRTGGFAFARSAGRKNAKTYFSDRSVDVNALEEA
jgi:hypothetical protein